MASNMVNKYVVFNETTGKRVKSQRGKIFLSKSGAYNVKVYTEQSFWNANIKVYKMVKVGTKASRLAAV